MHFRGEVDNYLVEENEVDFDYIEMFLEQMNNETSSFCTLSLDDFCYIQCAGSKEEMTIEWRYKTESGFRHFVIGRNQLIKIKRKVKYSAGGIIVRSNEVHNYKDALILFQVFFQQNDIHSLKYSFRETTEMFLEHN
ncbi:hypothetical protein [Paenibacillus lupini]|uniref:hypothetical protein n=1 Tax=Paenibacillus lupini TaxID=1450204 RepID=UPI001420AA89|nr:hypothetical protein [Paenibacillus lupini]NIK21608.1 hypothetical protein [Paenibacillus lupini]